MSNLAVYPGSFDPCTNGHLDVICRAVKIFDKLIVAVLENGDKVPKFTVEERINMLRKATEHIANIEVIAFDGLLAEFVDRIGASVIVKGLRAMSDFEYEFQMALTNKKLNNNAETIFIAAASEHSYLSSSMVKEIARYGGKITGFVPKVIEDDIIKKYSE